MKTIITTELEGQAIVTGIGQPCIDPVETRKRVDVAIRDTEEFLTVAESLKAFKGLYAARMRMKTLDRDARAKKDAATVARLQGEWEDNLIAEKDLRATMAEQGKSLLARKRAMMADLAIYCQPRAGEYLIEPAMADQVAGQVQQASGAFRSVRFDPATGQAVEVELQLDKRAKAEHEARQAEQEARQAAIAAQEAAQAGTEGK